MGDEDVLALAGLLHDAGFNDTAEALVTALEAERTFVALSVRREQILARTLSSARSCSSAR
jgi:hypothetical protein